MRYLILNIVATFFVTTLLYSQKISLKQAIKQYDSKNLSLAKKEIDRAIKTPFSSEEEISETMYYYFMINSDLYCSVESLANNLDMLPKITDAYEICKKHDRNGNYTLEMTQKVQEISSLLIKLADSKQNSGLFNDYFNTMDHFAILMKMIDVNCGPHYSQLAQTATNLGLDALSTKYWQKMIEENYNKKYAYRELIAMLYNLKQFEKVDQLLAEAKEIFPESTSFAEVEILRYVDKGMKFSALQLAKKVAELEPENADIIFLFGMLNTHHNEHEIALNSFLKVAHMQTDHFETHFELGKYYYKFYLMPGHLELAKEYLEKAYSLKPEDSNTLSMLQEVYIKLGDVKSASSLASN